MKTFKFLTLLTMAALVFACTSDDEEASNSAPEMSDQGFNASESIASGALIGSLAATCQLFCVAFANVDKADALFSVKAKK